MKTGQTLVLSGFQQTSLKAENRASAKTYWHRGLGGVTRNQHVLHYINTGEVDPLAAHCVCPIDEDSYTLLAP
ncbi:Conjugative transfer outer membrane protein PilQ [Candidatus Hamiltonella defensa (Bemisia tabaci)]|nr:Conjugative transfer outer membrane protein PilQ [Candidatus Hamiltonella defensa (Bemisia tabaci)]